MKAVGQLYGILNRLHDGGEDSWSIVKQHN